MSKVQCAACGVVVEHGELKEHFEASENPAHIEHIKRLNSEAVKPDSVPEAAKPSSRRKRGSRG